MVGKIYTGILEHRVRRGTDGLTYDEQGGGVQIREGVCRLDLHPKGDR